MKLVQWYAVLCAVALFVVGCAQGIGTVADAGLEVAVNPITKTVKVKDTSESGTTLENVEGSWTGDGGGSFKIGKAERQQSVTAVIELLNQRIAALESLNVNLQRQFGENTVNIQKQFGADAQAITQMIVDAVVSTIKTKYGIDLPTNGGTTPTEAVAKLDWATFTNTILPRLKTIAGSDLSVADKLKAAWSVMQETGWADGAVESVLRSMCPECYAEPTTEPTSDAGTRVRDGTDALTAATKMIENPKIRPGLFALLKRYGYSVVAAVDAKPARHLASDLIR